MSIRANSDSVREMFLESREDLQKRHMAAANDYLQSEGFQKLSPEDQGAIANAVAHLFFSEEEVEGLHEKAKQLAEADATTLATKQTTQGAFPESRISSPSSGE